MFATIESGAIARYPANPYADNPTTSFAAGWQGGAVGGTEYVTVQRTPRPTYDPLTQDCAEATPVLDDGAWVQQWTVTTASAEEQAARLAAKRAGMVVSRFQARAALMNAGLLDEVEAVIANPATSQLAKLAWDQVVEFRRTSPTLLELATALGMTDAQLDDLFVAAAGIEA